MGNELSFTRYRDWAPTGIDTPGLGFPADDDRQGWFVSPCIRTRDSGPRAESNYAAAVEILGEHEAKYEEHPLTHGGVKYEEHRFSHWGPGWFEVVLVRPDAAGEAAMIAIEYALSDCGVIDEEDLSRREYEAAQESWESWGCVEWRDAMMELHGADGADRGVWDGLEDDQVAAWKVYAAVAPAPYEVDGESVIFPSITDAELWTVTQAWDAFPRSMGAAHGYVIGFEDGQHDVEEEHDDLRRRLHDANFGGDHVPALTNCPGETCRELNGE